MAAWKKAAALAFLGACLFARTRCEDPEVHMNAMQLISSKGYPAEEHFVTTPDGYILRMHRIPYSKNDNGSNGTRPAFFLQHGLLCSSTNWLTNLVNESLAFILSDAGYDVWMGNVRGNTYSRNHTHLSPDNKAFWDFTFDEHTLIDLPTMVDRVVRITKQPKIFYAGHSQGTVMGFGGFTANKTLAGQIRAFFALAPVANVKHIGGLFAFLTNFVEELKLLFDLFGHGEFFPNDALMDFFADMLCPIDDDVEKICRDVLFLICGFDIQNFNTSRIPVYVSHTPAGTSVKNIIHFSQEVKSGLFEKYDYGKDGNMRAYGTPTPPKYNVSELMVPTALFSGLNDLLADPKDVDYLASEIKHTVFNHTVIKTYEHLDFIWGLNARCYVYNVVIELAKSFL